MRAALAAAPRITILRRAVHAPVCPVSTPQEGLPVDVSVDAASTSLENESTPGSRAIESLATADSAQPAEFAPPTEPLSELLAEPLTESVVVASEPYVGQWNHLVSTTNWQKGRIIVEWRESMSGQSVPVTAYSDEAWSRLVGGVTGQHVGRLRRVYQRFGATFQQYRGLYWSHFHAALDWDDAEMWLEGAVGSNWSVAQMRDQRWETLGKLEAEKPESADVVASETDEDFEPARTSQPREGASGETLTGEYGEIAAGPRLDGPDFGDESLPDATRGESAEYDAAPGDAAAPLVRPFEHLPELPDDVAEAFEGLKLAILRHKTDGWREVSAGDMLAALDALKSLVTAPSAETAPF